MILSVIRGQHTGIIPFIPRLDLWYKANKKNGTLPREYANAELIDITDDLGIGYHAVIPDFRDYENENGDIDLGLGIYRFKSIPYTVELHNIKRIVTRVNGMTAVEYATPYGSITTRVLYDETMEKSGATLAHVMEYAIKSVKDFDAIAYIFENAEIKPKYGGYTELRDYVGQRGVTVAFNSLGASPMHFIMKELMPMEAFFYESFDHPEELERLAERISAFYYKAFGIAADSPAEIILSGANYDSSITSPQFFGKYITPSLEMQAKQLHEKNKYLLTHTDGENRGLLEAFKKSGFDVADSICPAPMTSLTLKEVRDEFGESITIWGGIPSVSVLEESMNDREFEEYIEKTLMSVGKHDHIIFSIADTTPPAAKFGRIVRISEKIKELGSIL